MWTVVVEVHLPDGAGTIFQIGEFCHPTGAADFARDLEMKIGENKITASVAYSSDYLARWFSMLTRRQIHIRRPRRDLQLPPCEYDE